MADWSEVGTLRADDGSRRCGWCMSAPDYVAYHDDEWGRPVTDDVRLYEKICLEGFQSGLSWLTILRKRENFRRAFAGFVPETVARFGPADVERLLADKGIVRHRGKIEGTIANAAAALEARQRHGSLAALVWSFEPRRRGRPEPKRLGDLVPVTAESTALAKALRALGFRLVGPTTAYAAMQSLGLVTTWPAATSAPPARTTAAAWSSLVGRSARLRTRSGRAKTLPPGGRHPARPRPRPPTPIP